MGKGKGSANAQSSQERRSKLPYNEYVFAINHLFFKLFKHDGICFDRGKLCVCCSFGSFFGPSRPVISSRVIQESKSLLENELRTARSSSSNQTVRASIFFFSSRFYCLRCFC